MPRLKPIVFNKLEDYGSVNVENCTHLLGKIFPIQKFRLLDFKYLVDHHFTTCSIATVILWEGIDDTSTSTKTRT